jgi:sugar O-acyltransferase (sialic acid O-acetyltransferase NeuD family)
MKNLIIIGARGFGREVYNIAIQTKEYNSEWSVKGFLDDKPSALEGFQNYPQIISSVESYKIQDDDVFICALGDVRYKKEYVYKILKKGGKFINIIHPTVNLGLNTKIGIGCIICPYTYVSNDVTIGDFSTIQTHSAVGHDVIIGNFVQINALTFFGGFVKVQDEVTVNPGATILPNTIIGEGSTVGINSTVLKQVKANTTVFGTPAKEIL